MITLHKAKEDIARAVETGIVAQQVKDICLYILANATPFVLSSLRQIKDEHLDFGIELATKGMLSPPFPNCLFSAKDTEAAYLACFDKSMGNDRVVAFMLRVHRLGFIIPSAYAFYDRIKDETHIGSALNDAVLYEAIQSDNSDKKDTKQWLKKEAVAALQFSEAFCCLLMSKSVYVDIEPEPLRLNKKRALRGKAPIAETRHIQIRTDEHLVSRGHQGGTHASPVMHWRRGHMRRLESGKIVPVAPTIVNASDEHKPLAKEYIVT